MTGDGREERVILCYGDSNTWGFVPGSAGDRFPRHVRWPGVLEAILGAGFRVVEEGLSGRTTVLDDPLVPHRNGRTYLMPCLLSHRPLAFVVIFLGTNDLADRYSLPPLDIARAAVSLAVLARTSASGPGGDDPQVLVVCPPRLGAIDAVQDIMAGAPAKVRALPGAFARAAHEVSVPLLDLSAELAYSDVDGIHLDQEGHRQVARSVSAWIRQADMMR